MHDALTRLLVHVWGIWRYRASALLVAWLVCLAGWGMVYTLPDQYEASARVYVDTGSVLKPLLRGLAVQADVTTTASMMTRALLSRPNLEKIANETDLHTRAKNDREYQGLLDVLASKIEISTSNRNENLYDLRFRDNEPHVAKQVIEVVLSGFVTDTERLNRTDSGMAQEFLDRQIADYEKRLEDAENKLKEFKRKHVGLMPTEGEDYYQRLQRALAALDQVRLELREVQNRAEQLDREIEGEVPTFGFTTIEVQTPEINALNARIGTLEQDLGDLLLRYTEFHPDVIAARETIALLQEQKREAVARAKPFAAPERPEKNPVYQQLSIERGRAEAEAAVLKVRYQERLEQVNILKKAVNTIPKVEADLAKLNRDYNVIRAQYETLLQRKESARLSRQAEMNADDVFRVIDPPHVGDAPVGPNRLLFCTVVLVAALAAGAGFAFLRAQLTPVFYYTPALSSSLGLPVFGIVTKYKTPAETRRARLAFAGFSFSSAVLLATYAFVMVLSLENSPLRKYTIAMIKQVELMM